MAEPRKIKVLGFWATERPTYCDAFEYGHKKVLIDHGLNLTSNNQDWRKQENVFVFLAFEGVVPVGGIRLEVYDPRYHLSLERALNMYEPKVVEKILENGIEHFSEACGLWNDKTVAGEDLSLFLCHLCFAFAPEFECDHMVAFNGIYTYRISRGMGGDIVENIGDKGIFEYPNERFKSAVWKFDLHSFENTAAGFEELVKKIRNDITSELDIKNKKNGLNITIEIQERT